jgi:phage tail sheath protein FI
MNVQVSWPGIYTEEFTPGAPIQPVQTSVGAFIGTAAMGPVNTPTLITSWDQFQSLFGGFVATPPLTYLPAAVYGFFLNRANECYILRSSIGAQATTNLPTRPAGPDAALLATALAEGAAGNNITVTVSGSSLLAQMLAAIPVPQATLAVAQFNASVTGSNATFTELDLATNPGFAVNDRVLVTKGANQATVVISSIQTGPPVKLVLGVPLTFDPSTGTVRSADLQVGQKTFRIINPGSALALNQALPAGALISITLGGTSEIQTVYTAGGDTITLSSGLKNGYSLSGSAPQVASLEFDIVVNGFGAIETFSLLSMNPLNPRYWGNPSVVTSQLITLSLPPVPAAPTPSDPRPADGTYNLAGGADDDRTQALNQIITNPTQYLDMLNPYPVTLVAIPGVTDNNVQQQLVSYCGGKQDRFAILDGPAIDNTSGFTKLQSQFAFVRDSNGFGALYFPWIQVVNPLTGVTEFWPPSGHIMGIYGRTDQQLGVHHAPANANIVGAIGLQYRLTDQDQGPLNLLNINILRVFPEQADPLVWGARTTSTDSNWQYVNIRRLFIYVEQSIEQGIRWAVFEPNNQTLWKKLTRTITEFLTRVWQSGALVGDTAKQAFYVRIDEALNPPSTQALGQLYIEVGLAPAYPAEFIILRIGIWQGGSQTTEG